jgi:Nickel responsive protein SCO4226-like
MTILVVEHSFEQPLTEEALSAAFARLDPCLKARGASWKRSYVSADRQKMICEFEAADAEAVRASLRASETPFERVWVAQLYK